MLGFPMLYFKGRRIMMFQLSGFYGMGVSGLSLGAFGLEVSGTCCCRAMEPCVRCVSC